MCMHAVKNAIALYYNYGRAEGRVNKLKVIKRVMYSKAIFDLFNAKKQKCDISTNFGRNRSCVDKYNILLPTILVLNYCKGELNTQADIMNMKI